jgi:hypothetical protein
MQHVGISKVANIVEQSNDTFKISNTRYADSRDGRKDVRDVVCCMHRAMPTTLKPALYRSVPRRGGTFAMWVPLILSLACNSPRFRGRVTSINYTTCTLHAPKGSIVRTAILWCSCLLCNYVSGLSC